MIIGILQIGVLALMAIIGELNGLGWGILLVNCWWLARCLFINKN
ncbi:hypothetical protein ACLK14_22635 [Escherichia coli]